MDRIWLKSKKRWPTQPWIFHLCLEYHFDQRFIVLCLIHAASHLSSWIITPALLIAGEANLHLFSNANMMCVCACVHCHVRFRVLLDARACLLCFIVCTFQCECNCGELEVKTGSTGSHMHTPLPSGWIRWRGGGVGETERGKKL